MDSVILSLLDKSLRAYLHEPGLVGFPAQSTGKIRAMEVFPCSTRRCVKMCLECTWIGICRSNPIRSTGNNPRPRLEFRFPVRVQASHLSSCWVGFSPFLWFGSSLRTDRVVGCGFTQSKSAWNFLRAALTNCQTALSMPEPSPNRSLTMLHHKPIKGRTRVQTTSNILWVVMLLNIDQAM